jgi:hypothetical protein
VIAALLGGTHWGVIGSDGFTGAFFVATVVLVRLTSHALSAAGNESAEVTKARIDQRSPRASIRRAHESAEASIGESTEITLGIGPGAGLPRVASLGLVATLWVPIEVINESSVSGRLRLTAKASSIGSLDVVSRTAPQSDGYWALPAGGSRVSVLLQIVAPQPEWIKHGGADAEATFEVSDGFADGVVDSTTVRIQGFALAMVHGTPHAQHRTGPR